MVVPTADGQDRISTGNTGLDEVLGGGLPSRHMYLLEGMPGSGKTTLALEFLRCGAARRESVLYITLSETSEELRAVGRSHGWDLGGIDLLELSSVEDVLGSGAEQSILHSWEVELGGTIRLIQEQVDLRLPTRVVFDSLSEMRLLAQDALRFRRQILTLKQYFAGRNITVLLVDDLSTTDGERDGHLHSICHGVVTLERLTLDFGAARRRLQVQKLRGVDFLAGYHDMMLRRGGIDVFPRLVASGQHVSFDGETVTSGVDALDALLGGGPRRGTSTLITGPAGSGKTNIALQYLATACRRGERCVIYEFDERVGTLLARADSQGLALRDAIEAGHLTVRQIDPAEMSPGQFAAMVLEEVEARHARMIVIDSLSGYLASMPQEKQLILQIHELLSYLNQRGTVTFLINPQTGLMGGMAVADLNISYVADAVLLIRFFEAGGRIRKAISALKNRGGRHEDTIRELRIDDAGVRVGEPLIEFRGIMTGTPQYVGTAMPLLEERHGVPQ